MGVETLLQSLFLFVFYKWWQKKKISYGSTWIFILSKNLGEEEAMHFSLGQGTGREGAEHSICIASAVTGPAVPAPLSPSETLQPRYNPELTGSFKQHLKQVNNPIAYVQIFTKKYLCCPRQKCEQRRGTETNIPLHCSPCALLCRKKNLHNAQNS